MSLPASCTSPMGLGTCEQREYNQAVYSEKEKAGGRIKVKQLWREGICWVRAAPPRDQTHCKCWVHIPQPLPSPRRDAEEWLAYREQWACETGCVCTYLSAVSWWQWFYPKMKADGEKYMQQQPPILCQGHGVNPALKSCGNLKFPALQGFSLGDEQGLILLLSLPCSRLWDFFYKRNLSTWAFSPDSLPSLPSHWFSVIFLILDTVPTFSNIFRNRAMGINAPA